MGLIKQAKAASVRDDAQKAWTEGYSVFTPILNVPIARAGGIAGWSGGVPDLAMMVDEILAVGWTLHTWAVVSDSKGNPQAMPLFTR